MGHGQGRQPRNEMDRLGHHPNSRGARSEDALRRCGLEASEARRNRALREREIRRAQATDAELKSRDAAFFFRDGCERVLGE